MRTLAASDEATLPSSLAACARSARVVYDQRADRADRADANRDLQKCLKKYRALFECQKRVAAVAAKQEEGER